MGSATSLRTVGLQQSKTPGENNVSAQEYIKVTQKTIVVSRRRKGNVKGAKLGKYTDIYLRPSECKSLEIKEYPPIKLTGVAVIKADKFVVIDEIKKIVTFTAEGNGEYGKFGSWIEFKSQPKGICTLKENLYIAFADKTVKRVPMIDSLTVTNTFMMEDKCCSIMAYKGNLAVALENGRINIVDITGITLSRIILPKLDRGNYIPHSLVKTPDGNIIFCDTTHNAVLCIKADGSVVFTYKGMKNPLCAIFDLCQNIIVIGLNNDNGETVQLLTDQGNKIKVLKYRRELGMQPYCITYVKDSDKIAICGDSNKISFYNIEKCRPRTKRELALKQS